MNLDDYGKEPEKAEGYAEGTVKPRSYRIDRFYRWVWEQEDGYTVNLMHDHADGWMDHLAHRDVSATHKVNCQKSLQMLYKWLHHERGSGQWEPDITFSADNSSNPWDFLTKEERKAVRNAALEHGSVPSYNSLTPTERERWKRHLSQRFETPKSDATPDDWDRANGWKIPSLVWVSLDAGLRPRSTGQRWTGSTPTTVSFAFRRKTARKTPITGVSASAIGRRRSSRTGV